jgi:hypothetical protein
MENIPFINDHHFMTFMTLPIGYIIVKIKIIVNFPLSDKSYSKLQVNQLVKVYSVLYFCTCFLLRGRKIYGKLTETRLSVNGHTSD